MPGSVSIADYQHKCCELVVFLITSASVPSSEQWFWMHSCLVCCIHVKPEYWSETNLKMETAILYCTCPIMPPMSPFSMVRLVNRPSVTAGYSQCDFILMISLWSVTLSCRNLDKFGNSFSLHDGPEAAKPLIMMLPPLCSIIAIFSYWYAAMPFLFVSASWCSRTMTLNKFAFWSPVRSKTLTQ